MRIRRGCLVTVVTGHDRGILSCHDRRECMIDSRSAENHILSIFRFVTETNTRRDRFRTARKAGEHPRPTYIESDLKSNTLVACVSTHGHLNPMIRWTSTKTAECITIVIIVHSNEECKDRKLHNAEYI